MVFKGRSDSDNRTVSLRMTHKSLRCHRNTVIVFDRPTREGRPLISVTLRPSIPSLHSFIVFSGWCKLQYTTLNLL